MGQFSFLCKVSGEPIYSPQEDGELGDAVVLSLLKDGFIVEQMCGYYSGYGTVTGREHNDIRWAMDWDDVNDLMHRKDKSNGICAIKENLYTPDYVGNTRSEDDPNKGYFIKSFMMGIDDKRIKIFHKVIPPQIHKLISKTIPFVCNNFITYPLAEEGKYIPFVNFWFIHNKLEKIGRDHLELVFNENGYSIDIERASQNIDEISISPLFEENESGGYEYINDDWSIEKIINLFIKEFSLL